MAKERIQYRCGGCGQTAAQWAGRCLACGEWNALAAEAAPGGVTPGRSRRAVALGVGAGVERADVAAAADVEPAPTGVAEVDRVLGGGLVAGSVTLLGGEPGVGKSTLLLQVAMATAAVGRPVLYVCAEEATAQVRRRAARLGALPRELWLCGATSLDEIRVACDEVTPSVVVVDSVQSVVDPAVDSSPGAMTQVRAVAGAMVEEARRRRAAVVLVGHVTKEGTLAGPRVLEHVVDTVLAFEGDRHHALRLLRAVKHRFGATHDLGVFEMTGEGLVAVPDASGLFLADRHPGVAGSVVLPTLDGRRPLLVEVQALAAPSPLPSGRRSAQGVDAGRLGMALAVLDKRLSVQLWRHDVYALAVGGVRLTEPGADLALALAVISSLADQPCADDLVVFGEVGLGGEVRRVQQAERRLAEAARLGFRRAIVPRGVRSPNPDLVVEPVASVRDAVHRAGLAGALEGRRNSDVVEDALAVLPGSPRRSGF